MPLSANNSLSAKPTSRPLSLKLLATNPEKFSSLRPSSDAIGIPYRNIHETLPHIRRIPTCANYSLLWAAACLSCYIAVGPKDRKYRIPANFFLHFKTWNFPIVFMMAFAGFVCFGVFGGDGEYLRLLSMNSMIPAWYRDEMSESGFGVRYR